MDSTSSSEVSSNMPSSSMWANIKSIRHEIIAPMLALTPGEKVGRFVAARTSSGVIEVSYKTIDDVAQTRENLEQKLVVSPKSELPAEVTADNMDDSLDHAGSTKIRKAKNDGNSTSKYSKTGPGAPSTGVDAGDIVTTNVLSVFYLMSMHRHLLGLAMKQQQELRSRPVAVEPGIYGDISALLFKCCNVVIESGAKSEETEGMSKAQLQHHMRACNQFVHVSVLMLEQLLWHGVVDMRQLAMDQHRTVSVPPAVVTSSRGSSAANGSSSLAANDAPTLEIVASLIVELGQNPGFYYDYTILFNLFSPYMDPNFIFKKIILPLMDSRKYNVVETLLCGKVHRPQQPQQRQGGHKQPNAGSVTSSGSSSAPASAQDQSPHAGSGQPFAFKAKPLSMAVSFKSVTNMTLNYYYSPLAGGFDWFRAPSTRPQSHAKSYKSITGRENISAKETTAIQSNNKHLAPGSVQSSYLLMGGLELYDRIWEASIAVTAQQSSSNAGSLAPLPPATPPSSSAAMTPPPVPTNSSSDGSSTTVNSCTIFANRSLPVVFFGDIGDNTHLFYRLSDNNWNGQNDQMSRASWSFYQPVALSVIEHIVGLDELRENYEKNLLTIELFELGKQVAVSYQLAQYKSRMHIGKSKLVIRKYLHKGKNQLADDLVGRIKFPGEVVVMAKFLYDEYVERNQFLAAREHFNRYNLGKRPYFVANRVKNEDIERELQQRTAKFLSMPPTPAELSAHISPKPRPKFAGSERRPDFTVPITMVRSLESVDTAARVLYMELLPSNDRNNGFDVRVAVGDPQTCSPSPAAASAAETSDGTFHGTSILNVGIDMEWSYKRSEELALLQVATKEHVLLFDLSSLGEIGGSSGNGGEKAGTGATVAAQKTAKILEELFKNPRYRKISWAFNGCDKTMLRSAGNGIFQDSFKIFKNIVVADEAARKVYDELQRLGLLKELWGASPDLGSEHESTADGNAAAADGNEENSELIGGTSSSGKSNKLNKKKAAAALSATPGTALTTATEIFLGKPLCKIEQLSDWNLRPLSKAQEQYAALDAFCLLGIADVLEVYMNCFSGSRKDAGAERQDTDTGGVAQHYLGEGFASKVKKSVELAQARLGRGEYWSEVYTAKRSAATRDVKTKGDASEVDVWSPYLFQD